MRKNEISALFRTMEDTSSEHQPLPNNVFLIERLKHRLKSLEIGIERVRDPKTIYENERDRELDIDAITGSIYVLEELIEEYEEHKVENFWCSMLNLELEEKESYPTALEISDFLVSKGGTVIEEVCFSDYDRQTVIDFPLKNNRVNSLTILRFCINLTDSHRVTKVNLITSVLYKDESIYFIREHLQSVEELEDRWEDIHKFISKYDFFIEDLK